MTKVALLRGRGLLRNRDFEVDNLHGQSKGSGIGLNPGRVQRLKDLDQDEEGPAGLAQLPLQVLRSQARVDGPPPLLLAAQPSYPRLLAKDLAGKID